MDPQDIHPLRPSLSGMENYTCFAYPVITLKYAYFTKLEG